LSKLIWSGVPKNDILRSVAFSGNADGTNFMIGGVQDMECPDSEHGRMMRVSCERKMLASYF